MDAENPIEADTVEELDRRLAEGSAEAVRLLDGMREKAREVAKHLDRAGVPPELHWAAIEILERVESLEARVGDYAVAVRESE